ncbi:zinc ribbon domain-containing protein [Nonomuraea sp. NEAU-A123]|uniref:zinc ribbon domain-containing protein n=1 Tax=Nonomuraea sp. NEAU-A123 TaxID=2839649 RepID=UPI001BE4C5A6|nr:zinc ribbon domain-containing protein [Nonomuraea sp. NEAU-A123]MBT2227551.1 transposase [Nonomuraea sp. NEAU-A123]
MSELTATASCTAYAAVVEASGEVVAQGLLVRRVAWLAGLTGDLTARLVAVRWNAADLDALASGVGLDGRALPSKGWMALRRLGWGVRPPSGVHVCDRVLRCAQEQAARLLRLALHRRRLVAAIVATWPQNAGVRTSAEWEALRALLPGEVSAADIRNRTRQVRAYRDEHGVFPAGLTELEGPPKVAAQVVLAAADRQLLTLQRAGSRSARLRVRLPLVESPASAREWAWHLLPVALPPTVPPEAALCAPTVRVAKGRVCVDLPFRIPIGFAPATGHVVGCGFDWGLNTLLTGVAGRLAGERVVCDGRSFAYDASGVSAKLHRLRAEREHLAAKHRHLERLLAGITPVDSRYVALSTACQALGVEHERLRARIRHLNKALTWSAARWAVDQATAAGASVIYVEDLATLEARGRRGSVNARLSGQVRGQIVEAIRHLAAKHAIAVVTVPARGTSRYCPRCGTGTSLLTHCPAPDRLAERGWRWAFCPACGLSCDRDWAAAERIVSRGLLGQNATRTRRATGARTIATIVEGNVARARPTRKLTRAARRARRTRTDLHPRPAARDRAKNRPTPKRPTRTSANPRNNPMTFSRVPDRRTVPAPPPTGGGQRPAGHAPKPGRHPPYRTGHVRNSHHRTGFHHAKATPVLTLIEHRGSPKQATPVRVT